VDNESYKRNGVERVPTRAKDEKLPPDSSVNSAWPPPWLQVAGVASAGVSDAAPEVVVEPSPSPWDQVEPPTPKPPEPTPEWQPDMAELVDWFTGAELPTQPFDLAPWMRVEDPAKFYSVLRREIGEGPCGCRGRTRALAADLRRLREAVAG
jgi:hypothetical protein